MLPLLIEELRSIVDGKPAEIGDKSKRADGKTYQKVAKDKWEPVKGGGAKPPSELDKSKSSKKHKSSKGGKYFQTKLPMKGEAPPKVGEFAVPQPGGHWHTPKPRKKTTKEQHFDRKTGRYTPERRKLHRKILSQFLDQTQPVPEGKQPSAVLMMGGPASGKGQLTGMFDPTDFVSVDADRIKELLPEYQEAVAAGDRDAASLAHEESGYLASKLRDLALKQRKNVLLDGTGRYAGSYMHRMRQMQDQGYHVHLMMPDLDVDTARARAKKRGEESGRWVPDHVFGSAYRDIPGNFEQLAHAADSAMLFNNRDNPDKKPKLVWSRDAVGDYTHDEDFMDDFRSRHGSGGRRKQQKSSVESTLACVSSLLEGPKDAPDLTVDFKELTKNIPPESDEMPRSKFTPDEGLIVAVDDDSAMGDARG